MPVAACHVKDGKDDNDLFAHDEENEIRKAQDEDRADFREIHLQRHGRRYAVDGPLIAPDACFRLSEFAVRRTAGSFMN